MHGNLKAFVITLQESELGCKIAKEAVLAAQTFGIDANIHPAVLGYNSKPLFQQYNITNFLNHTIIDNPGHQGCFLSHFQLWLKCIELNETIMILEHDGIMIRQLPTDVLEHFTDVLRLDAFSAWKPNYNEFTEESLKEEVNYSRLPTECYYHSSGSYYVGAYGYLIKPSGAKKLIDFAVNRGVVCTEAHIGSNIVDIMSVTSSVVRLHNHYVDIGLENSTTHDLSKAIKGRNSMVGANYISPRKYKELYGR